MLMVDKKVLLIGGNRKYWKVVGQLELNQRAHSYVATTLQSMPQLQHVTSLALWILFCRTLAGVWTAKIENKTTTTSRDSTSLKILYSRTIRHRKERRRSLVGGFEEIASRVFVARVVTASIEYLFISRSREIKADLICIKTFVNQNLMWINTLQILLAIIFCLPFFFSSFFSINFLVKKSLQKTLLVFSYEVI